MLKRILLKASVSGDTMKLFLHLASKRKLLISIVLMIIFSFNGVLISSIVVYAGQFSGTSTFLDIMKFGVFSIIGWIVIYSANFFLDLEMGDIIRDANLTLKQRYFWSEFSKFGFNRDSSDILSTLSNDFKLIEVNYFQSMFSIIENVLLFVVSLVYMLYLNTWISLAFIIFSLLPMFIPGLMQGILKRTANDWSLANAQYIKRVKESIQGMGVLKAYAAMQIVYSMVKDNLTDVENKNYKLMKTESFAALLAALLSGISFIIPFVIGCYVIIFYKSLTLSVLIGIFLANDRVAGPLESIAESLNKISTTKDMVSKLTKLLDNEKYLESNSDTLQKIDKSVQILHVLNFDHVYYRINKDKFVSINGQFVGNFKILITGDSGSGKTTILNLIRGAIKPTKGVISAKSVKGKPIDLENNVAYIEQTPYIFDASVEDNVTLFQSKKYSHQDIISVLKKVSLYEELGGSNSLDFICGDNGSNLSGGQRQRIEIARALINKKSLYLVDELTANLDVTNANKVRKILFALKQPVIEVAHHFNDKDYMYTSKFIVEDGELNPLSS